MTNIIKITAFEMENFVTYYHTMSHKHVKGKKTKTVEHLWLYCTQIIYMLYKNMSVLAMLSQ